jgi:PAS domain S-box-containing protein
MSEKDDLKEKARFRALLELSPIPTLIANTQGNIVQVNDAWAKLWGIPAVVAEKLKDQYNILTDSQLESQGVKTQVESAFFRGERASTASIFYNASQIPENGRWVEIHFTPVKNENGELIEVILMMTDVTALKKAEKNVDVKQEQLEAILNNSPAVVYLKGIDGRIQMINQEYERIFNLKRSDIIGKSDFELHSKETAELFLQMDKRVIAEGKPIKQEETAPLADGMHHYISIKFPIRDSKGEICAVGGISTDITDQKKGEDEKSLLLIREKSARESSRMKSEFLANMSHEIRTPINGVIGMTGLLLDSGLTPQQADYADAIKRSGQGLLSIVNDILDLSKVEAGRMDLEVIAFEFKELLNGLEKTYSPLANKNGVAITVQIDTSLQGIHMGDSSRVRQVLSNFIANAVKFTHSGAILIHASLEAKGPEMDDVLIRVRDTGIGVPQEAETRLFETFSQADNSTSRKFGGTGLGLSIAKKFAHLMKGSVGYLRIPSGGSEFWLKIPLKRGTERRLVARVQDPRAPISFANQKLRILVAEDNQVNQIITMKMLEKMGLSADLVANGREAVDAMTNIKYDLILMDCQMPEMDGYDATRQIRLLNEKSFSKLPILALTAGAMQSDQDKCFESGMDDVITKPVRAEFLAAKIQHWLKKKAA